MAGFRRSTGGGWQDSGLHPTPLHWGLAEQGSPSAARASCSHRATAHAAGSSGTAKRGTASPSCLDTRAFPSLPQGRLSRVGPTFPVIRHGL